MVRYTPTRAHLQQRQYFSGLVQSDQRLALRIQRPVVGVDEPNAFRRPAAAEKHPLRDLEVHNAVPTQRGVERQPDGIAVLRHEKAEQGPSAAHDLRRGAGMGEGTMTLAELAPQGTRIAPPLLCERTTTAPASICS